MNKLLRSWSLQLSIIAGLTAVVLQTAAPAYAASATFALSPTSRSVNTGETFDIAVVLNSGGGQIAASDIDITYDQSKLLLVDVVNGTIFDQYVGESINNSNGKASITGLATSADALFSGSGTFATLRFQATNAGTANVAFDFTAGNRNDSNVAEYGNNTDILTSVTNGSYTIAGTVAATATPGAGSTSTSTSTSSTSTGTSTGSTATAPTATPRRAIGSTMPVTASPMPTLILTFSGIFLAWLGMLTGKNV